VLECVVVDQIDCRLHPSLDEFACRIELYRLVMLLKDDLYEMCLWVEVLLTTLSFL